MRLDAARVGDPDVVAAICDGLVDWPAHRLLLCVRRSRLRATHPFDLPSRAHRLTGLPVKRVDLPAAANARSRHGWMRRPGCHCVLDQPQAA
ncbi:MAG: hypothetical protein ACRDN8_13040 [Thermoleophilaceae bacterium]